MRLIHRLVKLLFFLEVLLSFLFDLRLEGGGEEVVGLLSEAPPLCDTNVEEESYEANQQDGKKDDLSSHEGIVGSSSITFWRISWIFCNLSSAPLLVRVGRPRTHDDLTWTDAGGGALYAVARGDLRLAWLDRDLRAATCLAQNLPTPELTDTDPVPPLGAPPSPFSRVQCWWYLVKCRGGGCVSPDFGEDYFGNLRFDGTPADPCP